MKRLLVLALTVLTHTSCLWAMEVPNFKIALRNNASRYGVSIPVAIAYTTNEGKLERPTVVYNDVLVFATFRGIKPGSTIKIESTGTFKSALSYTIDIPYNSLIPEWMRHHKGDDNTLIINISMENKWLGANLKADFEAAHFVPQGAQQRVLEYQNLLELFPRVTNYLIHYKMDHHAFLATENPKAKVSDAPDTTFEDVARYVLYLEKDYTADAVRGAYNRALSEWDPRIVEESSRKNGEGPEMQQERGRFANKVMHVIAHARDILMRALRDKHQAQ